MNSIERFWSKTAPGPGGCVDWMRGRDKDGYGKIRVDGRDFRAHRWIYEVSIGAPGPLLMHSCDRPPCVALQHLSPGTVLLNRRDAKAKGRIPRGESHQFATLDEETVIGIRARLADGESAAAIAKDLGITKTAADQVVKGWRHIPSDLVFFRRGARCGPLAAILIRQLKKRGARRSDLEYAFDLKCPTVNDIAAGRSHATALDHLLAPRTVHEG